jgi:tRNA dimethylallyltransferase
MDENRLLVLSGPTASGKTGAAVSLARLYPLEIVNADSMQVYRGMDIGTAKPSLDVRREIPHHLVDVADPDEPYSAGRYVADAERAIQDVRSRGRFPLVVGGTGLYIRALLRGLDPLPADPRIRARLAGRWDENGGKALFGELMMVDPASAARIHPRDKVRVVRALEVAEITGEPASARKESWSVGRSRYRILFLVLMIDRGELYRRIDSRVDEMFREGFVEEVRGLLAKGYGRGLPSMGAIGYRHVLSHLLDGVSLEKAVGQMKQDTRRYAKRQITWLSGEPGTALLKGKGAIGAAIEEAGAFLISPNPPS